MTATIPDTWGMPDGEIVLGPDASRDEWLAARRRGIGGSDAPVLLGVARYGSPYRVWLDKTGRGGDAPPTEAMTRGHWLEPHIADRFAAETGIEVREVGLAAHRDEPWLMATVDRLTADGGCLEIKSVSQWAEVRHEWARGVARDAYVQLQHQLLVTGRPHGWLAAYVIDRPPMYRGPIERDEPLLAHMRERFAGWWAAHVIADTPPPVDPSTLDGDELLSRWPNLEPGKVAQVAYPELVRGLLDERRELAALESRGRAAATRRKEIDTALAAMAGDAGALADGDRVVATFRDQNAAPQIDPAFAEDHPDLYARYVRRPRYRRITIPKESR